MNLDYYLLLKKKYNVILNNFNYLIKSYNFLIDYELENSNYYNVIKLLYNVNTLNEQKKEILKYKKKCISDIYNTCNHNFVIDFIDIIPEKTKKISYCKICDLKISEIIPTNYYDV